MNKILHCLRKVPLFFCLMMWCFGGFVPLNPASQFEAAWIYLRGYTYLHALQRAAVFERLLPSLWSGRMKHCRPEAEWILNHQCSQSCQEADFLGKFSPVIGFVLVRLTVQSASPGVAPVVARSHVFLIKSVPQLCAWMLHELTTTACNLGPWKTWSCA